MTRPLQAIGAAILAVALMLWLGDRADSAPSPAQIHLRSLERDQRLERGLLWRVCWAETRCRTVVSYGRGKGGTGCDVGPWAIHVRQCASKAGKARVKALLKWKANAKEGARILGDSYRKCERLGNPGRCKFCKGVFYNVRSKTWCGKVYGKRGGNT